MIITFFKNNFNIINVKLFLFKFINIDHYLKIKK